MCEYCDVNCNGFMDDVGVGTVSLNKNIFSSYYALRISFDFGHNAYPTFTLEKNNFTNEYWYIYIEPSNFTYEINSYYDYYNGSVNISEIEEKIFEYNGDVILHSVRSNPNSNAGIN